MGLSKTELFPQHYIDIAAMAKALAHPARIAILDYLIKKGECACGDIVEELPLSQSTVSQHLKSMKEAGIIRGDVDGVFRCYCINTTTCQSLMAQITKLFSGMTGCC